MLSFASKNAFWLYLLVPLFVALYIYIRGEYRRRMNAFGNPEMLKILSPEASWGKIRDKYIVTVLAFCFMVFALAGPRLPVNIRKAEEKGVELMFVVDVSNSMLAEDFKPSRLEQTKNSINSLLQRFTKDRVGMVIFAGRPYMQLPVTMDYTIARNFVSHVSPGMISEQGTDIAAALNLAGSAFSSESDMSRAIILISDGEAHDGDAAATARQLHEEGVIVNVVGIGTPEGSPIVIGGVEMRDENGNIVVTKLNEDLLRQIAINGGGAYVRATNNSLGLSDIVSQVRSMEQTSFTSLRYDQYRELYPIPLAIALLLLIYEFFILERRNRLLARIKFFNVDNED